MLFEWLESASRFTFSLMRMPVINNFHLVRNHFLPSRSPQLCIIALSLQFLILLQSPTLEPLLQEVAFALLLPKAPLPCLSFSGSTGPWSRVTLLKTAKQSCLSSLQRHFFPPLLEFKKELCLSTPSNIPGERKGWSSNTWSLLRGKQASYCSD